MDVTDIAEADAVAETATDTKQRGKLPEFCYACGAKVYGPYCWQCGQKNDNCRRSIFRLGAESMSDVFSVDSRVFRTLGTVVARPGKHVREFGNGRRSPYSPPIRFFLVVTLTFFFALWASNTHLFALHPEFGENEEGEIEFNMDVGFFEEERITSLTAEQRQFMADRVMNIDLDDGDGDEAATFLGETFTVNLIRQRILLKLEDPQALNKELNDILPVLTLILVPVMTILGAMVIRGRDALIYDHLLLSINTHAMIFIFLTVTLVGIRYATFIPAGLFTFLFIGGLPLYYLITLRGAFSRGWIKTIWATIWTWFWYSIVFLVTVSLGFVWAAIS